MWVFLHIYSIGAFLFQYIFEGLAHLAARILINASNYMERIDQASVHRMCRNAVALQQTLSSITAAREVALDQARNYYEMLYMDPEVGHIIIIIMRKAVKSCELHYIVFGIFAQNRKS